MQRPSRQRCYCHVVVYCDMYTCTGRLFCRDPTFLSGDFKDFVLKPFSNFYSILSYTDCAHIGHSDSKPHSIRSILNNQNRIENIFQNVLIRVTKFRPDSEYRRDDNNRFYISSIFTRSLILCWSCTMSRRTE